MFIFITQLTTSSMFHSFGKMLLDKTVARILLIFSVTDIALAAPAVLRQTHTGIAEAASEKRKGSDDKATDGSASELMPELVSDSDSSRYLSASTDSGSDRYFSAPESLDDTSLSESSHDDWPPVSPAASFREGSGAYYFFSYPVDHWRYDDESVLDQDSAPESTDGSSHHDPELALPTGSLHQDSAPESPPSGSLHQDAMLDSQPSGSLHQDAVSNLPPSGSLNQDAAPNSQPFGLLHQGATPDSQLPGSLHQDSALGSPLDETFFNDALKKKLKFFAGLGTTVGVSVGLTIGVQKLIKDIRSHRAYVSLFLPSLFCRHSIESQTF
jgi:hypothetical protein